MWFVEKTSAQGKSALRLLLLCEELTLLGSRLGHHLSLESEEALERRSSSHAASLTERSDGIRAITCRLCTTAERLRSSRFLRTPL